MKVLISITSYKRPKMLKNLLLQLKGNTITVWDDNSDFKIEGNKVKFYKFKRNFGKKEAWQKFDLIFDKLRQTDYDYYIFLPDDFEVCEDFVNKSINLFESIEDNKKICLSFSNPERAKQPNFNGIKPIDCGDVIKTQWCDLAFICTKEFINLAEVKEIPLSRWVDNEELGSGVGSALSTLFIQKGFNMYNCKEPMTKHLGNDDSKMNPLIRENNPL